MNGVNVFVVIAVMNSFEVPKMGMLGLFQTDEDAALE